MSNQNLGKTHQDPPCPWDHCVPTGCYSARTSSTPSADHDSHARVFVQLLREFQAMRPPDSHKLMALLVREVPSEQLFDIGFVNAVAASGHVAAMRWLLSRQPLPAWNETTCEAAAAAASIPMLELLRSCRPACPWSWSACAAASQPSSNHLQARETLTWLRSQDPPCPWHFSLCTAASQCGLSGRRSDFVVLLMNTPLAGCLLDQVPRGNSRQHSVIRACGIVEEINVEPVGVWGV